MNTPNIPRFLNERFQKALILEHPDPSLDEYLRAQGIEPERVPKSMTQDVDAIIARLEAGQHDLLYKRSKFEVDARVLDASKKLAAVLLCCIGDDSVDKEASAARGVLVMNDPISNARSVVELVLGEMICLARRVFDSNDETHRHEWVKNNKQRYELQGKTLGIVGLGNIGKQVAQVCSAFGMEIFFHDDREIPREVGRTLGWTYCDSLEQVFRQSDFLTLHTSAENARGQSNKNLITHEHFKVFGEARGTNSPRIFINAGRGFLLDPKVLNEAIKEGHVNYAAVDVFPKEPGSSQDAWMSPYGDMPQVITTPHIGAATQEAQPRIASYVAGTTRRFNLHGMVRSCVYNPGHLIGVNVDRASHILTVVHSDTRGTKKAINDCLFDAGLNNLESSHRDFSKYSCAYDVSAMDGPLTQEQLHELVDRAIHISGDTSAIRAIRQIKL